MTIRLFVTSSALMICCWLAATFLRVVPMDTYPGAPAVSPAMREAPEPAVAINLGETAGRIASTGGVP